MPEAADRLAICPAAWTTRNTWREGKRLCARAGFAKRGGNFEVEGLAKLGRSWDEMDQTGKSSTHGINLDKIRPDSLGDWGQGLQCGCGECCTHLPYTKKPRTWTPPVSKELS